MEKTKRDLLVERLMREMQVPRAVAEKMAMETEEKRKERNVVFLRGDWSSIDTGGSYLAAEIRGDVVQFHEKNEFSGKESHSFTLTIDEFKKITKKLEGDE